MRDSKGGLRYIPGGVIPVQVMQSERREQNRVNVLVTVYCEQHRRFVAAYSLDMSKGGLFVKTREPFDQGSRVDLEFVLPECDEVLRAVGEVRWVVAGGGRGKAVGGTGMGIEFVEISENVSHKLSNYVRTCTGEEISFC
jgi:type IV pilus assembly protein PilZ